MNEQELQEGVKKLQVNIKRMVDLVDKGFEPSHHSILVGMILKQARMAKNISRDDLSLMSGIEWGHIAGIEDGWFTDDDKDKLTKLATVLDVKHWLIDVYVEIESE